MFGGIEAGGTKFICAVSDSELHVMNKESFETTNPKETMEKVIAFFKPYLAELKAIGVGSFGPIDIDIESPRYGYITSTPKLDWQQFDFVGTLKDTLNIPIVWTTDVNAAAYGEYRLGHGVSKTSLVYYTIGTGVGGGAIQNGQFISGFSHPEMGHMLIEPHPDDNFTGNCPFHRTCLEGMAAGPAIEKRFGKKGQEMSENDIFWEIEADYIAQCVYNTTLMLSPELIILGGGVMQQEHMIQRVRQFFEEKMNSYVTYPKAEDYILTPKLANNAGILGCLQLAKDL